MFTLELAGRYTFYAFEYDGSFEIVQELVEVIQEYLAGNYLLGQKWFGRTRLVIQAAGSVWEGAAKA
ncbi:MAG: hypothetical protein IPL43_07645 [Micropruina sp.]|nr:hypothetical protein [Micropruina sp.]